MSEVRIGTSPDFHLSFGDRVRESIRKRLTFSGARDAWFEQNQDKVEQFHKIEQQLDAKQRERVMEKLEHQASRDAFGEIGLNYLALASVIGSIYVGGKILYDALIGYRVRPKLDRISSVFRHPIASLKETLARATRMKSVPEKHS